MRLKKFWYYRLMLDDDDGAKSQKKNIYKVVSVHSSYLFFVNKLLEIFFFKNFSRLFFRTVEIQVTFKPWCVNLCKNHDFYKTMTYSAIFYISHSKKLLLSMSWVLYIVKIMVTAMLDPHVFIKFELLQKTLIKMRIDVNQPVDKPSITLK